MANATRASMQPIKIKGTKFFLSNGTQFSIRGVRYNPNKDGDTVPGGFDPLTNLERCARDIPTILSLGFNTILVDSLYAQADHAGCINEFKAAGLYIVYDLARSVFSCLSGDVCNAAWDVQSFSDYTTILKEIILYENTLAIFVATSFAGSLLPNGNTFTVEPIPYIKAAIRDIKTFVNENSPRQIPLGVVSESNKIADTLVPAYLSCASEREAVDFWVVTSNDGMWCGAIGNLTSSYRGLGIPTIFGNDHCPNMSDHPEVTSLYGAEMSQVFSGGFLTGLFDWNGSPSGLFNISNSTNPQQVFVPTPNSTSFSKRLGMQSQVLLQESAYTPTQARIPACPTDNSTWVGFQTLPPVADGLVCSCMVNTRPCAIDITSQYNFNSTLSIIKSTNIKAMWGLRRITQNGTYGAFSMCSAQQKLAWAINRIYQDQIEAGQDAKCDAIIFSATRQSSSSPHPNCSNWIYEAGPYGEQVITGKVVAPQNLTIPLASQNSTSPSSTSWPGRKIAGVTAGMVVVLCLIVTTVCYVWRRKHGRRQKSTEISSHAVSDDNIGFGTKAELHGEPGKVELSGQGHLEELNGDMARVEMLGESGREELHGEDVKPEMEGEDRIELPASSPHMSKLTCGNLNLKANLDFHDCRLPEEQIPELAEDQTS